MTLIIGFAAENLVFQVSDRRLTVIARRRDGTYTQRPHTRPENKSVIFRNQAVFGYTGLASIEAEPTHMWIAKVLANVPSGDLLETVHTLRDELTRVWSTKRKYAGCEQSVLVSGFRPASNGALPFHAVISNSRNGTTHPGKQFELDIQLLVPEQVSIRQTPRWLNQVRLDALLSEIVDLIGRQAEYWEAVELIGGEVRRLALHEPKVGADLMLSMVPRPDLSRPPRLRVEGGVYPNYPTHDGASFCYLPTSGQPIVYSPTAVIDHVIVSDLKIL